MTGRCEVKVTERRTRIDWAHQLEELVDVHYPNAAKIVLVMDNLNTHAKASLDEAFEAQKAKRLADKLEIHYTPRTGSWLNVAEIMLHLLVIQCLARRIADISTLATEVAHWNRRHNHKAKKVVWHFTTEKARIKLKRLYPVLQT